MLAIYPPPVTTLAGYTLRVEELMELEGLSRAAARRLAIEESRPKAAPGPTAPRPAWRDDMATWTAAYLRMWSTQYNTFCTRDGMSTDEAGRAAYDFVVKVAHAETLHDPAALRAKREKAMEGRPSVLSFDPTVKRARRPAPAAFRPADGRRLQS